MARFTITFRHPKLAVLSEMTFRRLLKAIRHEVRYVQEEEVEDLIRASPLADSQKQSVRARIEPQAQSLPSFYIEGISRGSLVVEVVLSAAAIWLLQLTIGQAIKDAFQRTESYEWLVRTLSTRKRIARQQDRLIDRFGEGLVIHRFRVRRTEVHRAKAALDLVVHLETVKTIEETIDATLLTDEVVLRVIRQEIRRLKAAARSRPIPGPG